MTPIEVRGITPDDFRHEIEASLQQSRENKYASQVGSKDLDFDVDENKLAEQSLIVPFKTIDQAETALFTGAIRSVTFLEYDDTLHHLSVFDPHPMGFSGFMDYVPHSLDITDHGLFEVGRYPAVSPSNFGRFWQWFLHRRQVLVKGRIEISDTGYFNIIADQLCLGAKAGKATPIEKAE